MGKIDMPRPKKNPELEQLHATYERVMKKKNRRPTPASGFTFDTMKLCLTEGWGDLGARVAETWLEFNNTYFSGMLRPLPIFFSQTAPYGHWVGLCSCDDHSRSICLCRPNEASRLRADRGVLLHEMLHQSLVESGNSPKHAHQPWRDGISRLHMQITGQTLNASGQKVVKVKQPDGSRKSVRVMADDASLSQIEIATWPHSVGIKLGAL